MVLELGRFGADARLFSRRRPVELMLKMNKFWTLFLGSRIRILVPDLKERSEVRIQANFGS
jgi:hypothetical protein